MEERSPADLPPFRHFEDIGLVSARTDWSGDESLVVFKCGPPLGHAAVGRFQYDPGSGHVHPDANHLAIYGNGEWLLRDDGYGWKQTSQHNTLLINGAGQMGEGAMWFHGIDPIRANARPRIQKAAPGAVYDEVIGDAATADPAAAGLKKFERRVIFWKPNAALVIDEVETKAQQDLELRFHTEFPCEPADGGFVARGRKAALRIENLTPSGVQAGCGDLPGRNRDGGPMSLTGVKMSCRGSRWRNISALSWAPASSNPARITVEARAGELTFQRAGGETLKIRGAA